MRGVTVGRGGPTPTHEARLNPVSAALAAIPLVDQAATHAQAAVAANTAVWGKLVNTGGDLMVNLAASVVIVVVTLWVSRWAGRLTDQGLGRLHRRGGADRTLQVFAASVVRNVVIILGAIAVLQQLGVKTTSIVAAVGAASLAIGLAMQGALSNVAAGVMILVFRPYRVGDIIESAGRTGRVRSLDLFVTELATLDNLKIVIPNAKVFGDIIINHSFHDRRRADVVFRIPLAADSKAVMDRVRARLDADPRVFADPPPIIEITGMAEPWVEIAVRPWAAANDYGPVKADVLLCARLLEADPAAKLPPPTVASNDPVPDSERQPTTRKARSAGRR